MAACSGWGSVGGECCWVGAGIVGGVGVIASSGTRADGESVVEPDRLAGAI
jgi:hypothetical protein